MQFSWTARAGALAMVARGFAVFPLRPNSRVVFDKTDRHVPRGLRGGIHRATRDAALVGRWFDLCPDMNYGVLIDFGAVLDADAKKGPHWLAELAALEPYGPTLIVRTTTGGLHIYFSGEPTGQSPISSTLDVRSVGGYVVGPGSVIDGKSYVIELDAPLAPMPEHIRAKTNRPRERRKKTPTVQATPLAPVDRTGFEEEIAWARSFLRREPGIVEPGRNNKYFELAAHMKDRGVPMEIAGELLDEIWCPKCDPPYFDDPNKPGTLQSAYNREVEGGSASEEFSSIALCPEVEAAQAKFAKDAKEFEDARREAADKRGAKILDEVKKARKFAPLNLHAKIKPRNWLIKNDVLRGSLTTILAPGGVGKSALTVGIAVAAAAGNAEHLGMVLASDKPRFKTLLISNEDDGEELLRRIHGACTVAKKLPEDLNGWIHAYTQDTHDPFLAYRRDGKALVPTPDIAYLTEYIRENAIDLAVYDPYVEMHHGEENNAGDTAKVMQALRKVHEDTQTAGIVVHHTRKPQSGQKYVPGDVDDARGSGAFRANVRRAFTLQRPLPEDIEQFRWDRDDEWRRWLRLDSAKGNYSPADAKTRWFQVLSIELDKPTDTTAVALRRADPTDQDGAMRDLFFDVLGPVVEKTERGLTVAELQEPVQENDRTREYCEPSKGKNLHSRIKYVLEKHFEGRSYNRNGKTMRFALDGAKYRLTVTTDPEMPA